MDKIELLEFLTDHDSNLAEVAAAFDLTEPACGRGRASGQSASRVLFDFIRCAERCVMKRRARLVGCGGIKSVEVDGCPV